MTLTTRIPLKRRIKLRYVRPFCVKLVHNKMRGILFIHIYSLAQDQKKRPFRGAQNASAGKKIKVATTQEDAKPGRCKSSAMACLSYLI
mgnify:CR=1 FL=1